ncbi:MAG: hypothetical protein KAI40_11260 [Desulfobacterales bacterium]|nr:hypothetical protein [Desulfobacterales bacterium]
MRLTDPDIIKEGEKDLIDAIKDDLDLDSINEIIKDKLKIKNLESKGGKIIVHNNKVAFKIEFELSLSGSLMFDREGNHILDDEKNDIDDSVPESKSDTDDNKVDELDEEESSETDVDDSNGASDKSEIEISETVIDDEDEDENEDEDIDFGEDVEDIPQELITEDDLPEDSDSETSSELDLDINTFGGVEDIDDIEEDEDDIDFSDDEDIGDILKESRDFWEKKKK